MPNDTISSLMPASASPVMKYSWEEFKLYFETTEKVIDRRIALNTWSYSICIAMLAASGLITNWMAQNAELRIILLFAISMMSVIGIIFSRLWYRQLKDLKLLNNAKFEVLEDMAPHVKFPDGCQSFEVFKKEWQILTKRGATAKKWGLRVKVLKSSGAEFLLPWSFGVIFGLTLGISIAILCFNRNEISVESFKLPAIQKIGSCKRCESSR